MDSTVSITAIIAVAGIVLLFVTRRLMRLVIRLALAGGLLLVILIGGLAWWYGSGRTAWQQKEKPSTTRRDRSR